MLSDELRRRAVLLMDLLVAAVAVQLYLDVWILNRLNDIQREPLVILLRSMTGKTSEFGLVCAFGMVLALLWRTVASDLHFSAHDILIPNRCIFIFSTCMAALTIADLLKVAAGRARPTLLVHDGTYGYRLFGGVRGFDSFPSAHAAIAFALAAAVSIVWPEHKRLAFGIAIIIALTRVIAGYHYPSDAIVGCMVGVGTAWLARWLFERNDIRVTSEDMAR